VVDRASLERMYTCKRIGGSNPPLSASIKKRLKGAFFIWRRESKARGALRGDSKRLPDILRPKGVKISTTCTAPVRREIPPLSASIKKRLKGAFFIWRRESKARGALRGDSKPD
jgi:hypothetical protein